MRRLVILLKNILSIPYRLFFTNISILAGLQDSEVNKKAAICKGVRFYRSKLGKYSYIGNNTFITNAIIGSFTSIANNCYVGGTSHPIGWVSTSPVFHKWSNILHKNFAKFDFEIFQTTEIGNDVWIGNNSMIKSGIKIGDGAIIGMGSIVTKDVPAYEIWAGNPARRIRNRFDDEMKEYLIKSKWWEWDDLEISSYAHLFNKPELFCDAVSDYRNT